MLIQTDRIYQIDAFRGYALFGLFLVHCVELFELHWFAPQSTPIFEQVFFLFAGKAFLMFALSFGVSFSIITGLDSNSRSDNAIILRRMAYLFAFGVIHTAIYRGDILMILAVVGLTLIAINKIKKPITLLILALVFLLNLPLILRLIMTEMGVPTSLALLSEANTDSLNTYMQGNISETLWANLSSGNSVKWLFMLESGRVSQILGMMILGLYLARIDFFKQLNTFCKLRRQLIVIFAVAFVIANHFAPELIEKLNSNESKAGFYNRFLITGYVNILFACMQTLIFYELWFLLKGRVLNMLCAIGQMSLSFYIGQSLIFIPIMYNACLGLYDDFSVLTWFLVGIFSFVIQLVAAQYWMKSFYHGPLEWLWRAATKQSLAVPFKRKSCKA